MAPVSVTGVQFDDKVFPPTVTPTNSTKTLFLSGAGLREGEREGKWLKFSAVGVYLEDSAVPYLAAKWKGKSAQELESSEAFLNDVITGPFEKFVYVQVIEPLNGGRWSAAQTKISTELWKSQGVYTDAEGKALEKLAKVMEPEVFETGSGVFTTVSASGTFTFSFTKDASIPKVGNVVIENKLLAAEVIAVNIGINCHVPNLRKSVVERLTELINNQVAGVHVSGINVEFAKYPPSIKPPGAKKTLFLSGAGLRDGEREGKYMKFSAVSLYLEDKALPYLTAKWKGKTAEELENSDEFLTDLNSGPFEKLVFVQALEPLFGERWSGRQADLCRSLWKSWGKYTDAEAKALDQFYGVMSVETFLPGHFVFQTLSEDGTLTLSFSKDGSVPQGSNAVITNKLLTQNIVDVNIGRNGVTPLTRKCVATRLADLINKQA